MWGIDVSDLQLVHPRQVYMDVFLPSGIDPQSGLFIEYDERLYPFLGRILKASDDCRYVRVGDVVTYPPMVYDELIERNGRMIYTTREDMLDAVIEGYDSMLAETDIPELRPAACKVR